MQAEDEKLEQLKQDLLAFFEDLSNERLINAKKLENAPPGSYPYGEGMRDGLRYAAAKLEKILSSYGPAWQIQS